MKNKFSDSYFFSYGRFCTKNSQNFLDLLNNRPKISIFFRPKRCANWASFGTEKNHWLAFLNQVPKQSYQLQGLFIHSKSKNRKNLKFGSAFASVHCQCTEANAEPNFRFLRFLDFEWINSPCNWVRLFGNLIQKR